jgi:hypothetical protein
MLFFYCQVHIEEAEDTNNDNTDADSRPPVWKQTCCRSLTPCGFGLTLKADFDFLVLHTISFSLSLLFSYFFVSFYSISLFSFSFFLPLLRTSGFWLLSQVAARPLVLFVCLSVVFSSVLFVMTSASQSPRVTSQRDVSGYACDGSPKRSKFLLPRLTQSITIL